jgi:hypothetical protein
MHSTTKKTYRRLFPTIDLNKTELSVDDIKIIVNHFFNDINFDNENIIEFIAKLDKNFKNTQYYKKEFSKLINPSRSKYGSTIDIKYWIYRGWSERESKEKISNIQKQRSKFNINYWKKLGYNESVAEEKIKDIQSSLSKKSNQVFDIEFWKSNGLSDFDAREKIKIHSEKRSCFNTKFWLNKGLTAKESILKVRDLQNNWDLSKKINQIGETAAIEWFKNRKQALSKKMTGSGNPMYNKPVPVGSGAGISGYYKNYYFRSLTEYYAIKNFEIKNINFICNDVSKKKNSKKITVKYKLNGVDRTYTPDFVLNNDTVCEVKNSYTINSKETKEKLKALRKFIEKSQQYKYLKVITEKDLCIDKNLCFEDYIKGDLIIDINKQQRFFKQLGKIYETFIAEKNNK